MWLYEKISVLLCFSSESVWRSSSSIVLMAHSWHSKTGGTTITHEIRVESTERTEIERVWPWSLWSTWAKLVLVLIVLVQPVRAKLMLAVRSMLAVQANSAMLVLATRHISGIRGHEGSELLILVSPPDIIILTLSWSSCSCFWEISKKQTENTLNRLTGFSF